jgi:hypothetical protein
VLPAAASLQKQGANKGATTAFLIATPIRGRFDLRHLPALDPIMTVVRPVAAHHRHFGGILENILNWPKGARRCGSIAVVPSTTAATASTVR